MLGVPGQPERRSRAVLNWIIFRRRPVTAVVRLQKGLMAVANIQGVTSESPSRPKRGGMKYSTAILGVGLISLAIGIGCWAVAANGMASTHNQIAQSVTPPRPSTLAIGISRASRPLKYAVPFIVIGGVLTTAGGLLRLFTRSS